MIQIITGPRDCGKTSRLLSLFNQNQTGDGLLSIKQFHPASNQITGYRLLHLSSQKSHSLARRTSPGSPPSATPQQYQLGDFTFSPSAFTYAETLLNTLIERQIQPIYLDEIGLLELNDHGFAPIVPALIVSGLDLILAIRHRYLDEAIDTFSIPSPSIVKL